jgi:hypothetical protein
LFFVFLLLPMKQLFKYLGFLFILTFFLSSEGKSQFYNGSFQEFGKNRVQEVTFFWQYYDFQRFRVFFYGNGKEHAEYVARSAHKSLQELELFFETELDSKLEILVFNRQSDFKQSNIGLTNDITSNIGGKSNIIGTKMFVYFEDDHAKFDNQIKASLTEVIVNKMVYQNNWKKVVRGSATVALPDWFTEGLYSYKSSEWNSEIDNVVKDNVLNNNYEKLGRIHPTQAKYAGHAMWNYIAQVYGDEVITQILYLVSVSKSFETSFRFVLGKSTKALNADFVSYYKKQYRALESKKKLPLQDEIIIKRKKKRGKVTHYSISPDGSKIAYSTNDLGKYFIWIYNIETKRYTKVLKRGYKIERKEDESYPLIDWHPDGKTLAFVEERSGAVFFNFYDLESKKTRKIQVQKINKITSFSYNNTGTQFVFSGVQKGNVDLYLYTILGNGYLQLTNDFYDEKDPSFIENSSKIIFSSNRKNDSLYLDVERKPIPHKFDLYIYDLNKKFQRTLKRVTNTPNFNEYQPFETSNNQFTFTSDQNGVVNRYVAVFDSIISSVDTVISYRYYSKSSVLTNYKRNILKMDFTNENKNLGILMYQDGEYKFYKGSASVDKMIAENVGDFYYQNANDQSFISQQKKSTVEILQVIPDKINDSIINTNYYRFIEEKLAPAKKEKDKNEMVFMNPTNSIGKKKPVVNEEFILPSTKLYNINFTLDEVTSQLDNNFINNSYQVFNPNQPVFNNPNLNVFNMVQMKDLMEDYRLIGGMNLSFNLRDNDFLIVFEDLAQRIDKKYFFSRQVYTNENGLYPVRTMIHEFKYRLKYPLSEVAAVGLTFNLRNDLTVVSSLNRQSLESEEISRNMGGLKLEYIYDNTFDRGINLYEGTRLKLFGEFYHEIYEEKTDFFVVGADVRHYQKIHREITFANRFAASSSFGNRKLVYFMGGVDGGFAPTFNEQTILPTDKGFAFQTIATPMRGFIQNSRFGNSFAVINSELRWPIFRYFSQYPVQSRFLSSFQIVGFGDVGTAWTGPNPYSIDNSFNKREVSQKPLTIILENQREPIIFGYGFGLRAELFGYFVRYDWSCGIEDGVNQGRINYFSLSLDF